MIADFVAQFARLIASYPDDVRVEVKAMKQQRFFSMPIKPI